jgi:Transposase DDE domain group 1
MKFCEFFGLQYAIGIGRSSRLQAGAQRLERRLARRYRRTGEPQRSFSSFRYRAHPWSHQRRICYKAEHALAGSNLRFLVTNLSGRSRSVFSFYNHRGECENRIEEFKNGFAADRLSCHRFRANAFSLLLHSFAYNLVNLFRLQLPSSMRSAQIETLRIQLFRIDCHWLD